MVMNIICGQYNYEYAGTIIRYTRHLNLLRCFSWFLPKPLLVLFLNSYILPHFDYCDVVWSSCTKSQCHQLESLLNFTCRTVLCRTRYSSASAVRSDLGLSTLLSRRKLHLAQLVFIIFWAKSFQLLWCITMEIASNCNQRSSRLPRLLQKVC